MFRPANCILLLFLIASPALRAQLRPGTYVTVFPVERECLRITILPGNKLKLDMGRESNGLAERLLSYRIDSSKRPARIAIAMKQEAGHGQPLLTAWFRRIDARQFYLGLDPDYGAQHLNDPSSPMNYHLQYFDSSDLIGRLQVYEQNPNCTAAPAVQVLERGPGQRETIYLNGGKPLRSDRFQASELRTYDRDTQLVSVQYLDAGHRPRNNQFGVAIERYVYDAQGRKVLQELRGSDGRYIRYEGRGVPRMEWIYRDTVLEEERRLINNPALQSLVPARLEFIYDSYGDWALTRAYLQNGSERKDPAQERTQAALLQWLRSLTFYPDSFEPILFGRFGESFEHDARGKVPGSGTSFLYAEFYLNDRQGQRRKYTGSFELDERGHLRGIREKTGPEGPAPRRGTSSGDLESFLERFGKARPLVK
ncbi:hypothetical protein [Flaviaesturariibacter aridisoli]|uniref:RHS repeat protein n=1 Tax=Flaviaesturariibacter aridisoli TaxID=2545761 RepID=A0A4R4E1E8_9BACT|nr:hypothetical protein [Flaviaesturariibacter aridisoli]TCZ73304.1 hypothetical protein E0486_06430 [Flaviaesturariibacter aridisoli]